MQAQGKSKVVYLNQQPGNYKENQGRSQQSVKRPLVIAMVGLASIFICSVPIFTALQAQSVNQENLLQAKAQYQEVQAAHAKLQEEAQRLNDPDYLAQVARKDYYYSKEGEIIFKLEGLEDDGFDQAAQANRP